VNLSGGLELLSGSISIAKLTLTVAQVAYNVHLIAAFLLVDILQTVCVTITTTRDARTKKGMNFLYFFILQVSIIIRLALSLAKLFTFQSQFGIDLL